MSFLHRSWEIKPLSTSIINKGYIPLVENQYNLLVGEGGTFKSFFALKSAVVFILDHPSKNVFCALKEDGINENKRRLKLICDFMNVDYKEIDKNIFWHTVEHEPLTFVEKLAQPTINTDMLNNFCKELISANVGMVILDTLKRMHRGLQENDSTDMGYLVNGVFNEIPRKAEVTLLVVHHSSKGEGSSVRGSSSISDDSRLTWALSKEIKKNAMTGKTEKDENATKIKLSIYKENGTASRECSIRDENGFIDIPFRDAPTYSYQNKYGNTTSAPTVTEYKEQNIPIKQPETHQKSKVVETDNPIITLSHKTAVEDYNATKDFKVEKMSLEDFVDMNCDINWHYSSIQWKDGYRSKDNYISYEDVLIYDIDDGMTIEEAKSYFKDYNAVILPTKSHQIDKKGLVCDRFRVIIPYLKPLEETENTAMRIKTEIYKEVGADLQVATSSSKFRGSPSKHNPIYLNGSKLFDYSKYKKIVLIDIENERAKKESQRLKREALIANSDNDTLLDVEDIKSRLDREIVADIVSSCGYEVNRQFKFKYRPDEKTASASISPDLLIKDFGSDLSTDIIGFIQECKGASFKTALETVESFVGVSGNISMPVL